MIKITNFQKISDSLSSQYFGPLATLHCPEIAILGGLVPYSNEGR
jgi:hypothetical protein